MEKVQSIESMQRVCEIGSMCEKGLAGRGYQQMDIPNLTQSSRQGQ